MTNQKLPLDEEPLPLGEKLLLRIKKMGLNETSFAKLIGVSQGTVRNWVHSRDVKPDDDNEKKAKEFLRKCCRTCGQYTEDKNAWDNSETDERAPTERETGKTRGPSST